MGTLSPPGSKEISELYIHQSIHSCLAQKTVGNMLGSITCLVIGFHKPHLTREFVVNIVGCRGEGVGEGRMDFAGGAKKIWGSLE